MRNLLIKNILQLRRHFAYIIPKKIFEKICSNFKRVTSSEQAESFTLIVVLKVQSCKLYNKKCDASTQITSAEIFACISVLDFKLLNRKVLFINRKNNKNC